MRIISGTKRGILINPPPGLPVRPTTDRAKESLFNILNSYFDRKELSVLDLFSGTGNISLEFASRGATSVLSIDNDANCVRFIKEISVKLSFKNIEVKKLDVFMFLKSCENSFDIIFADAPYALPRIIEIPGIIKEKNLLKENGMLIIEHAAFLDLSNQSGFFDIRKYGQSAFSFFKFPNV